MIEQDTAGAISTLAPGDVQRHLWASGPLTGGPRGAFTGHLWSEVWADGFACVAMSDSRLIGKAMMALTGAQPSGVDVALPSGPVMMGRAGQAFLGRVIVDFYAGRAPMVAVAGQEPARLVEITRQRLGQLA